MPSKQQNTTQEEAIRRYEALPDELKQAMSSIASAETIYGIGKKFGLNIEDTGNLASIIGYMILGMVPATRFVDSVKDVTGVNNEKAAEIAREVNQKIFLAIREKLKETHGANWDEREIMRTPTEELRSKNQEVRTTPATPPTPTTPKSPWEIRPDGFDRSKQVTEMKSVIPQAKPTTDNQQLTTKAQEAEIKKPQPPEPPKTREAPQPMRGPGGPEVLKEIRPIGGHEQTRTADTNRREQQNEQARTAPTPMAPKPTPSKPETPKATPPAGLPFMKEVSKLTQTPELQGVVTPTKPETPKPTQEQPTTTTQTPTVPQTQTPAPQKPPQPPSAPTQKYSTDPYREPIE
ncbi:MAG: hypothetical protein Q7R73_04270 [bacterium]|nr:hypothetical protein [bacterium]